LGLVVFVAYTVSNLAVAMDDSRYRRNFDLDKKNEIPLPLLEMSKIAKFGCELLQITRGKNNHGA
jgi:hypothetical protein